MVGNDVHKRRHSPRLSAVKSLKTVQPHINLSQATGLHHVAHVPERVQQAVEQDFIVWSVRVQDRQVGTAVDTARWSVMPERTPRAVGE